MNSQKLKPAQLTASAPDTSIWVSASAGTGKTKVLISRLLRLLLSGCHPEKILCITYTKTAAAEITERLQNITREWAISSDSALSSSIIDLTNEKPDIDQIKRARSLFALILNLREGMQIMTIHAFCQSILSRFPFEANVPVHFSVADENKKNDMMTLAKHHLIWQQGQETEDFSYFIDYLEEEDQNSLLKNIFTKRMQIERLLADYPSKDSYHHALCELFNCPTNVNINELVSNYFANTQHQELRALANLLRDGSNKTSQEQATVIHSFLDDPQNFLDEYISVYVTDSYTPRSRFITGFDKKGNAWAESLMIAEQERALQFVRTRNALVIINASAALYSIARHIFISYQQLKHEHSLLDYDDQISLTRNLLCDSQQYLWVLYKLDNRIEHLLIDEAQDTSPAQWQIAEAVTDEFFSGNTRYKAGERTVFVVGDEKQSIFSFQNADPVGFARSGNAIRNKALAAQQKWGTISLIENFRSSPLILDLVDQAFDDPALSSQITHTVQTIQHVAARQDLPGCIELWPTIPYSKEIPSLKRQLQLADKIAYHVAMLLQDKSNRPGDVMILVNRRAPMVTKLVKAFKDRGIPVSAPDQLVLHEHIAIKDCLSFIQFVLNPRDDYNTACFLKSPFIGLDDDAILGLRLYDKKKPLAENLLSSEHHEIIHYLETVKAIASSDSCIAFIHAILDRPCPNDEISGRHALIRHLGYDTGDVLENFLSSAYDYQKNECGHLQRFHKFILDKSDFVKKDANDADKSSVRIMTVHSSKGLQSKIVILADSTSRPLPYKYSKDVLWAENDMFLWPVLNDKTIPVLKQIKDMLQAQNYAEYYRLLYVALTRAEQHLIVCGCESNTKSDAHLNWYEIIRHAVHKLANKDTYKTERRAFLDQEVLLLSFDLLTTEKLNDKQEQDKVTTIPKSLRTAPQVEPFRASPLRPSQPLSIEPAIISPLSYMQREQNFQRGVLLHRLFRVIPEFDVLYQENTLDDILANEKLLSPSQRNSIKSEVLSVLRHPEFSPLFSQQARSEVPLIGDILLNGQPYTVSGQVDRLYVDDSRVLIVDYKTNRPPALEESDVAEIYRLQMLSYKLLLEKIYPDKKIETAILWTSIPYLLPLSV